MSNTALDQSIRHWIRIARGEGASQGSSNCALCAEVTTLSGFVNCYACPIGDSTGYVGCLGTPYQAFERMAKRYGRTIYSGLTAKNPKTKALAWDMARFLQSLKNEETPPWARPRCH